MRKDLSLYSTYAVSVGATLSAGFFLLPGLAVREAGPAVMVAYGLAFLPLLPGILSKVELATAMPRAGGVYYFVDRAMGPALGTIAGIGTWSALILKVAFALVGLGFYARLLWGGFPAIGIAVTLAVAFGLLNILSAKHTGSFQGILVAILLLLVAVFVMVGAPQIEWSHFDGFFDAGTGGILSTAGLVCVSYIGLSKIASVAEEVAQPERNLPRAMFLAAGTALAVYLLGTTVMVGVLLPSDFHMPGQPDMTPVASAAMVMAGPWGVLVMTVAAILAFFSVANAGIMSASRYPLAMSRDALLPPAFQHLGRFGTPTLGIIVTVLLIIAAVVFLDPLKIAKLAGAFQLLLFALNCLSVIIMRESRIAAYDPGYRAPWYPWLQIVGIIAPLVLIVAMGWLPILFSAGMVAFGLLWFIVYGCKRVTRQGAIRQLFGRLAAPLYHDLDVELRTILKEKGLREHDPFDEIFREALVLDATHEETFETIVEQASLGLAARVPCSAEILRNGFLEGTRTGATPVLGGIALPHMHIPDLNEAHVMMVRTTEGVIIECSGSMAQPDNAPPKKTQSQKTTPDNTQPEKTFAVFFLVSPDSDPAQHLRILAQLATRVEQPGFIEAWRNAKDHDQLRALLIDG